MVLIKYLKIVLCLIPIPLIFIGCATMKSVKQEMSGLMANAPKKLDSDPNKTGLLILDCDLEGRKSVGPLGYNIKANLTSASIIKVDGNRNLINSGTQSSGLFGKSIDVVIFHNLEPGTYQVVVVRGESRSGNKSTNHRFSTAEAEEFVVDIKPVVPTYLGHVLIKAEKDKNSYEWDTSAEQEMTAWEKVQKKYSDSNWYALIAQRIDFLQKALSQK